MDADTDDSTVSMEAQPVADSEGGPRARRATVLQVLPALGAGGGVERGTVEIAAAVVAGGGRALVASEGGAAVHDLTRAGGEHFVLPLASKNPLVMRANVGRLAALIESEGVDIVHARSRAPAWSACIAARRTGRHFLTTFHGTYSAGNWRKRRYNAVMTRGERVIALSVFIAGHIHRVYGVPARLIRVIHRGVDLARFDPARVSVGRVVTLAREWRLPDGVPVVMLPGRLTRWKGQAFLIEAIGRMRRRDIRCLLVGSDQGRTAYRRELEALISHHGGARETVIAGETGWLTPPGNAQALADAIERVLDLSETARRALAEKAIAHVRRNFSKDTMCTKTLDVYDEVLALTDAER